MAWVFLTCSLGRRYARRMPDAPELRPASAEEVRGALAFALRFECRKRHHHVDGFMAELAAEKLVEHLRRAGFVVMKKPATPPHSVP